MNGRLTTDDILKAMEAKSLHEVKKELVEFQDRAKRFEEIASSLERYIEYRSIHRQTGPRSQGKRSIGLCLLGILSILIVISPVYGSGLTANWQQEHSEGISHWEMEISFDGTDWSLLTEIEYPGEQANHSMFLDIVLDDPQGTLHLRMRTLDQWGNASGYSNTATTNWNSVPPATPTVGGIVIFWDQM